MIGVWQGLLANLAVVAAVVMVWANVREFLDGIGGRVETIVFGLVMGGGALLSMALAIRLAPGLMFDFRDAPLAVAGFFGGPLGGLLAAAPALVYRIWMGGAGAGPGCLNIALVAGFAALQRWLIRERPVGNPDIVGLAAVAAAVGLLGFLALPPALGIPMLMQVGGPMTSLNLIGVTLAGLSILREERRHDLVRSNALYRAVIEALPDCLNVKDLDGRFIAANPATARLMQATAPDDLIGKTDFDFYPEAVAREFRLEELAVRSADKEVTIEQQARFEDGGTAWLSTLKVPFRNPRGEVIGLITHNRDVTDTKVMQLDLQKTRQHLADALANMADGLVMYDSDLRIVMCNEQYRALFPLTADVRAAGAHLPDILRQSAARGEEKLPPGTSLETWIASVLARLRQGGDRVIALTGDRWIEARTRPVDDGGFLTIFSDVTSRKREERELQHRAEHDPLTGLANRATFKTCLAKAHLHAGTRGTEFAVMLVDLDRFKQVNDRFGHGVGDELLIGIARRLEVACRPGDLVARLGGDEFAVLSEGIALDAAIPRLAQRILEGLTRPFATGDVSLLPGGSIGFSIFPHDPSDPDTLLVHADQALYAAKATGRRKWVAYGGSPSVGRLTSLA